MSERQRYVEEALAAYQVAGQYRLLSMRTGLGEFAELSKLYIERAWRFERYANELPVKEDKPVVEEKKEMHPISRLITLFVIVLLVLSMGSAGAQDAPLETNTADVIEGTATLVLSTEIAPPVEVTLSPEQPVVIIDNNPPPIDNGVNNFYVFGFVVVVIYTALKDYFKSRETKSLVDGVNSLVSNQQSLTLAQQRYAEASIGVQEAVKLFQAFVGVVSAANIPGLDPLADAGKSALDQIVNPPAATQPATNPPMSGWKSQYPDDGELHG